jgi:polyhydroxybutyrate depolymerase
LPRPSPIRRIGILALLLPSILFVAACEGGTRLLLQHDGIERSSLVERPSRPPGPRPLLVILHGATLDGAETRRELRAERAPGAAGLVIAFPDAGGAIWNDGSLSRAVSPWLSGGDDLGFIDALIARLVADGTADPAAIHLAGISSGGMMALRYACRRADRIASVMVLMATMAPEDERECRPARPLDVLMLAGTADPVTRWNGEVAFAGLTVLQQRLSVPASFAFWRRANGCAGMAPPVSLPRRGRVGRPDVVVHAATGCAGGVRTTLYEVRGGGHRLPGDDEWPLLWPLGPATPDVDAGALLVQFALGRRAMAAR